MENALTDSQRTRDGAAFAPPTGWETMRHSGFAGAGFAHDFNNFLSSILGSLEMIQRHLSEGRTHEVHRHVDTATRCARQAAILTGRLLATAGREGMAGDDATLPTDLGPIMKVVGESLRGTIPSSIEIEVAECDGLWPSCVDPVEFENMLLNVCTNSIDAMPEGGRLTIDAGNAVLTHAAATGIGAPCGEYATLIISDTGTGMPPEIAARAFDPLFTTKAPGRGTGLGLWRARQFVAQAGGQMSIESVPGNGTLVVVHLPRYVPSGSQCRPSFSSSASAPAGPWLPAA